MSGADDELDVVLQQIAARARERNRARTGRLADLVPSLGSPGEDPSLRELAVELAHQVAGSAGTFGARDAGRIARELEAALRDGSPARPTGEGDPDHLRRLIEELRRALEG
ncbi:Hpt domain-containing protein [Oerskovia flava]|uniref:Hpt domain-containing protein n=1 Tax=Oerskovia flava TaxID=2986422 RepID=UPI00223F750D|nr:Hpt domain-containing protein [Oerskovia sp. JB1-3-2]